MMSFYYALCAARANNVVRLKRVSYSILHLFAIASSSKFTTLFHTSCGFALSLRLIILNDTPSDNYIARISDISSSIIADEGTILSFIAQNVL